VSQELTQNHYHLVLKHLEVAKQQRCPKCSEYKVGAEMILLLVCARVSTARGSGMHPKVGKFGAYTWLFGSTDRDDSTSASRRVSGEVEGT
jgi:hypothetical protein